MLLFPRSCGKFCRANKLKLDRLQQSQPVFSNMDHVHTGLQSLETQAAFANQFKIPVEAPQAALCDRSPTCCVESPVAVPFCGYVSTPLSMCRLKASGVRGRTDSYIAPCLFKAVKNGPSPKNGQLFKIF